MNATKLSLIAAVLLLAGTGTAIESYNGSNNSDMHIMGDASSASATTAVGQNGSRYKAKVIMNQTTSTPNHTVGTPSYTADQLKTVTFSGRTVASTPCHTLDHSIEKTSNNSYRLTIKTVKNQQDQLCTQQLAGIEYTATIKSPDPFNVTVIHDEREMKQFTYPTTQSPDSKTNPNIFKRFIKWVQGLF